MLQGNCIVEQESIGLHIYTSASLGNGKERNLIFKRVESRTRRTQIDRMGKKEEWKGKTEKRNLRIKWSK